MLVHVVPHPWQTSERPDSARRGEPARKEVHRSAPILDADLLTGPAQREGAQRGRYLQIRLLHGTATNDSGQVVGDLASGAFLYADGTLTAPLAGTAGPHSGQRSGVARRS